jgi:hypothetical protein
MPTIQIRDIPTEYYEALRRQATVEGKSLQSFMRDRVIAMGKQLRKAEAWARVRAIVRENPPLNVTTESILADLDAGRHER